MCTSRGQVVEVHNINNKNLVHSRSLQNKTPMRKCTFKGVGRLTARVCDAAKSVKSDNALGEQGKKFLSPVLRRINNEKIKEWLNSEPGGIIVNSLGTGIVAPIFIAYNPLAKTDENTKKYTALRQPVSAVIAVGVQVGVVKQLNKFLDKLANTGKLGNSIWLNCEKLNQENYIKEEMKRLGKSANWVDEQLKLQRDTAIESLKKDGTFYVAENIKLSDKDMHNLINSTIDNYKSVVEKKLKEYDAHNAVIPEKITRARLLMNEKNTATIKEICKGIIEAKSVKEVKDMLDGYLKSQNPDIKLLAEEFLSRSTSLNSVLERAKRTKARIEDFTIRIARGHFIIDNSEILLDKLKKVANGTGDFNTIMKELLVFGEKESDLTRGKVYQNGFVSDMVKDLSWRVDDASRKEHANVLIKLIEELKKIKGTDINLVNQDIIEVYEKRLYSGQEADAHNVIKRLEGLKLKQNDSRSAREVMQQYAKEFCDDVYELINKNSFAEDIIDNYKKISKNRFGGFKQITGVLTGACITLPISCYLLNWAYPRFMDMFFPSLGKNKNVAPEEKAAAKGGK